MMNYLLALVAVVAVQHAAVHAYTSERYEAGSANVYIPEPSDNQTAQPALVLELSGRCQSGRDVERALNFRRLVDTKNFVLIVPEARRNTAFCPTCGPPFFGGPSCQAWAASPACCANDGVVPTLENRASFEPRDDVTYLHDMIKHAVSNYNADARKIYVFGYSAGGFMAHRLACEKSTEIAAIFSLTGGGIVEPGLCAAWNNTTAGSPVAVAHAHPMRDAVFPADGGTFDGAPTPSANETVSGWAEFNGCEGGVQVINGLDLFRSGGLFARGQDQDTSRVAFNNCGDGGNVEFWTIPSGTHVGVVTQNRPALAESILEFFYANPKPNSLAMLVN